MKISVYCKTTGSIKRLVDCSEGQIQCNLGDNLSYVEGHHDPLCFTVDVESGLVVDYQPPQPSEHHEWNETTKRWVLSQAEQKRIADIAMAKAQIEKLEGSQLRPLRELALDQYNADARYRVNQIEEQIAAHRAIIKENTRNG